MLVLDVKASALEIDPRALQGSGGGGGKKGGGGGKEAPNSLRSTARARLVELISEGVFGGLCNGARSIFFDRTPVENADGSFNYEGVKWEQRKGLPDQAHFGGVKQVETPVEVEVEVKANQTPPVRTITEANADAARVIVRIPSLAFTTKKGDIEGASVSYAVESRSSGGNWVIAELVNIVDEKCTSPYERQTYVPLAPGGAPWDLRVRRITADSEEVKLQNETIWAGYSILVEGKFTYPNSGIVYVEIDAEKFGSQMPTRYFEVDGIECEVPSNYDARARTYTGSWDGTFKRAITNCPPWIFYNLLTEDRYGLGEFIDATRIDKWNLYTIAKYCDETIPSGFQDEQGNDLLERRFSFNGVINDRKEAFKVLQDLTTAFRGMAYWSLGQVVAVADMPTDAKKLVTPANVIGGQFNYNTTAMKTRHSVALVTWNDPADMYSRAVEVVIDDEALRKWGWREIEVQPMGCNSRGQAHRFGRWILDTEQNETETVEYTASDDHADLRPGDIIKVADPRKANYRIGGRIRAINGGTQVTLDQLFEQTAGATYQLHAELTDGKLETRNVTAFNINGGVAGVAARASVTFAALPTSHTLTINGLVINFTTTSAGAGQTTVFRGASTTATAVNFAKLVNTSTLPQLANLYAVQTANAVALIDRRKGTIGNANTLVRSSSSVFTPIAAFAGGVNEISRPTIVTLESAFTSDPQVEALWAMTGTDAKPRHFRVLAVTEDDDNNFKINALFHDPNKFARVERKMSFSPTQYTRPVNFIKPPTNLKAEEVLYYRDGKATMRLMLSWSPSDDFIAVGYDVVAQGPSGKVDYGVVRGNSIDIDNAMPGNWTFQVRSVSHAKLRSAPATISLTSNGWEGNPSPTVTALTLKNAVAGQSTVFLTTRPEFAWSNVFPGIEADGPNEFWDVNIVRVYDAVSGSLLREEEIRATSYAYDFAKNQADNLAQGRDPSRQVQVQVAVRDIFRRTSPFVQLTVSNPPPAALAPTTVPGMRQFFLKWVTPTDADYDGVRVWISQTSGFTPGPANLYFDGKASMVTPEAVEGQVYYARVAAYDVFSKSGLSISGEIQCQSILTIVDLEAPAVPTGLAIASSVLPTGQAKVTATWNANAEADLAYYDIEIATAAAPNDWIANATSTNRYEWTLPVNTGFRFRLRARDVSNNRSNYATVVTHTTARDTTAPAVPASLVATPMFGSFWLTWAKVADLDLDYYEIYMGSVATAPVAGTTATYRAWGEQLSPNGFAAGAQRWFWVRAVDTSGNKSAWSALATATTVKVTIPNIEEQPAPLAPTGVTLNHVTTPSSDGSSAARLQITWAAPASGTVATSFTVAIREGAGNYSFVNVTVGAGDTPRFELAVTPGQSYTVKVAAVDVLGLRGAYSGEVSRLITGDTVAPATPITLTVKPGFKALWLSWAAVSASDLSGYEIYESAATTAPTTGTAATYRTGSNSLTRGDLANAVTMNYWVRSVDMSGNKSAWSTMASATTLKVELPDITIVTAPTPTGLALAQRTTVAPDGTTTVRLIASWDQVGAAVAYSLIVTEAGQNRSTFVVGKTASSPTFELDVIPGKTYAAQVASLNEFGQASAFSSSVALVITGDTVAPPVPTGFVADAGFKTVWLTWTPVVANDLDYIEVYESATTTAPVVGAAPTFTTTGSTFVRENLAAGLTRHYWVRSVDFTGNKSAWSARVQATTKQIESVDVAGAIDLTSFAAGLTAPGVGTSLPAVTASSPKTFYLMTTGVIYKQNAAGTGWIAQSDASLIVGKIVAGQIEVGAVGADQIAANAVTVKHLLLTDFENLIPNGGFFQAGTFADVWLSNGPTYVSESADAYSGGYAIQITKPAGTTSFYTTMRDFLPVIGGESYWVEAVVKSGTGVAGGGFYYRLNWFDANKVALSPSYTDAWNSAAVPVDWLTYSKQMVAPAGAKFCKVMLYSHSNSSITTTLWGRVAMRRANAAKLLVDGAVEANHIKVGTLETLAANVGTAWIESAYIKELDAGRLKAGTAILGSVLIGGTAASTVASGAALGAQDPATRINAGATRLDPGRVLISGGAALSSWIFGGDNTSIDGGKLGADTVAANALNIGMRGITVQGIEFEHQKPSAQRFANTAGSIAYTNDQGVVTAVEIAGGNSGVWTSGTIYAYWVKGATAITYGTNAAFALASNAVCLATYRGGADLVATYGRTIIDGSGIKTGTVDANQLKAFSITASKLAIGDTSNMFPDPEMRDASSYTGSAFSLRPSPVDGGPSTNQLRIEPDETPRAVYSAAITIEGLKSYFVSVWGETTGSAANPAQLGVQFYSDREAVTALGALIEVGSRGGATPAPIKGQVTAPAGALRMKLVFYRAATVSSGVSFTGPLVRPAMTGELIVDGAITAGKVAAGALEAIAATIGTAWITSGHIVELDASKIKANTILSESIIVGGSTLSTVRTNAALGAQDPATRINAGTTRIDPGRVIITGTTTISTIAPWLASDLTSIDGGRIFTGSIEAQSIVLGARGLDTLSIEFTYDKTANLLSWTAGGIFYYGSTGVRTYQAIIAGSVTPNNQAYIWWNPAQGGALGVTNNNQWNTAGTGIRESDKVVLATFSPAVGLAVMRGGTVIDGAKIVTGTIDASVSIKTGTITAEKIQIGLGTANLIPNPTADSGSVGSWGLVEGTGAAALTANAAGYSGSAAFKIAGAAGNTAYGCRSFPVKAGKTYAFRFALRASAAVTSGVYCRIAWKTSRPATENLLIGSGVAGVDTRTNYTNVGYNNSALGTSWVETEHVFTAPVGAQWANIAFYRWAGMGTAELHIDGLDFREQATAVTIADGAIYAKHIQVSDLVASLATIGTAYITEANISGKLSGNVIDANAIFAGTIKVGARTLSSIDSDAGAAIGKFSGAGGTLPAANAGFNFAGSGSKGGNALDTDTVDGRSASTVRAEAILGASDPAVRINSGSTTIDPGRILISGGVLLSSWIGGTNSTEINGGAIAANTIVGNKLAIGLRGLVIDGVQFEHNSPAAGRVSWTAGSISYIDDANLPQTVAIAAGSDTVVATLAAPRYVYWNKGATTLAVTPSAANANNLSLRVCLAAYRGGSDLNANYGRTVIDGDSIKTGTITATQLNVTSARAAILIADVITTTMIAAGQITASKLSIGDTGNAWADYEMADPASYASSTSAVYSFQLTSSAGYGPRYLRVTANAAHSVETIWRSCEAGDYYVTSMLGAAGGTITGANSRLYVQFANASGGTITPGRKVLIGTTVGAPAKITGKVAATTSEKKFRFVIENDTTTATYIYWSAPIFRRMAGGELIVDGAITTDKLFAGAVTAEKITVTSLSAISANLGSITAGSIDIGSGKFVVDSGGNVTIKSSPTGQRMELSAGLMLIYDAAGVERVRLGVW